MTHNIIVSGDRLKQGCLVLVRPRFLTPEPFPVMGQLTVLYILLKDVLEPRLASQNARVT